MCIAFFFVYFMDLKKNRMQTFTRLCTASGGENEVKITSVTSHPCAAVRHYGDVHVHIQYSLSHMYTTHTLL